MISQVFLVVCTDVFFFFPHCAGHRQNKNDVYLVYENVIAFCFGPKLGVFCDDLQGFGHQVLRLLVAA